MNIESEVKDTIRSGGTNEQKATKISSITTFTKDKVLKCLINGGNEVSDIYWNIVKAHKNEDNN